MAEFCCFAEGSGSLSRIRKHRAGPCKFVVSYDRAREAYPLLYPQNNQRGGPRRGRVSIHFSTSERSQPTAPPPKS